MSQQTRLLGVLGAAVALLAASCAVTTDEAAEQPASFEEEWNDAYDQHGGGKFDTPGCSGVLLPDQSGFERRVALTFDDGPSTATTPQVLDILDSHGAKATFFINGKNVRGESHRLILERMVSSGHIVGNHGQEHHNMKNLSIDAFDAQIRPVYDLTTSLGETRLFFRFPYGSASCAHVDHVESYGYGVTGWHIDSADWCFANSRGGVGYCSPETFRHVPDAYRSDMLAYTLSQVRSKNGGVLLFHDVHQNTVNNLDAILSALEAEDYRFTTLDDEGAFPRLNGLTPPFVGHSCENDTECEFSASGHQGACLTHAGGGFCTVGCEGYCPDRPGDAPTFCVSLAGGESGTCVSKSSAENDYCAELPGTSAVLMDRYIGSSGAPASSDTVCVP